MSVIDNPTPSLAPGADLDHGRNLHGDNYLNHGKGFLSWALTVDHKRIGLMYMVGVLFSFFVGGIFAIALRTELIAPGATLMFWAGNDDALLNSNWRLYNQLFTVHGAVMVFMFIIPAIPAILGNFVLPIMLGAKDVAFPKLNLLSLYCWVGGSIFFLWILTGGVVGTLLGIPEGDMPWFFPKGLDTGWTFYTPYSTTTNTGVLLGTIGVFILGFSSILTGVNFIATIHMLRPKGMGWGRLPLVLWALYATAIIQILATPVLAITVLLLMAERALGIGVFDPSMGGDPVLYQHFFWFYSHPAVYIMILPALGVISEIITVHSRKHIFGYKFIAASSLAIALFGFIVWGHHMFTSGQSPLLNSIFSLLTMSVAIPSAVKVFNYLATMYGGRIRLDTPMLYAIGFIWLFTIGGLTGLPLAALSTDIHYHDTYFVVAHFHYVMVGSTLFAFMGGMYHWWPKMFGKMYNEFWGRLGAILVFIGFNATFFIQFIAGSQGMPRRYADYDDQYFIYHLLSTLGSYILTVGLFIVLFNWMHSLMAGTHWGKLISLGKWDKPERLAPANPWGANTLEWHTPSPPPHANFEDGQEPVGVEPYDYDGWDYDPEIDGYVRKKDYVEPAGH
jgi:cytochrome c oxidase subunit 1